MLLTVATPARGEPGIPARAPEPHWLAGVGRAAVSNWRKRYPDFPQPVGGSPNSPTFGRGEVIGWLNATGKAEHGVITNDFTEITEAEALRTVARIRASAADNE